MSLINQSLDNFQHLGDFLGSIRNNIRSRYIQSRHIFKITFGKLLRQFTWGNTQCISTVNDFILDISNILHEFNFITTENKVAADGIEDNGIHGMTKMRFSVRRQKDSDQS